MFKKICIFVLLVLSTFMLASCSDGESTISPDLLNQNIPAQDVVKVPKNQVTLSTIASEYIVDNYYYNIAGLIKVRDQDYNYSVWSLFKGDVLFPYEENLTIQIFNVSNLGYYVSTTNLENKVTVYDILGNIVVEKDKYYYWSVTGSRKAIYDDNNKLLYYEYYETITTLTDTDYTAGVRENTFKTYKIDSLAKTRTEVINENNDYYPGADAKVDLKQLGLEGYYARTYNDYIYIYDDANVLKAKIRQDEGNFIGGMDGVIIAQNIYEVDEKSENYSYIYNSRKYLLKTYAYDLMTGNKKELKVNYRIEDFDQFKDENGKYKYGYVEIKDIISKNLADGTLNVIIDKNGKIISEVGPFNILTLKRIANGHYYDASSRSILNANLEPIFTFNSGAIPYFVPNVELVIIQNNIYYGAIDYSGKIIIPFDYISIATPFYNGKTLAINKSNKNYLLNSNGTSTEITENVYQISNGLFFKYNNTGSLNQAFIMDYNGIEKERFDYVSPAIPNFLTFTNIYGSYYVARFALESGYKYVLVDATLE